MVEVSNLKRIKHIRWTKVLEFRIDMGFSWIWGSRRACFVGGNNMMIVVGWGDIIGVQP